MICSRATGSAITGTGVGAISLASTCALPSEGASRSSTPDTTAPSSMWRMGWRSPGRSSNRRSRATTSAARLACCTVCSSAWRSTSMSGGLSCNSLRAAWALASTAVSGWLISWATPAPTSASVPSLLTWPSRSSAWARSRSARWVRQASTPQAAPATAAHHTASSVQGRWPQVRALRVCTVNGWLWLAMALLASSGQFPAGPAVG